MNNINENLRRNDFFSTGFEPLEKKRKNEDPILNHFPGYARGDRPQTKGGFGEILFVRGMQDGKEYVIKFSKEGSRKSKQSLEREIAILEEIDHPHIIKKITSYQDEDISSFLVEEGGEELFSIVQNESGLSLSMTNAVAQQAFSALQYLHSLGIVHADIKPENILYKEGRILLIDFGFSFKDLDQKGIRGTPEYMSPEIFLKKGNGFGRDIWALACVLFFVNTGLMLFDVNPEGTPVDMFSSLIPIQEMTLGNKYPLDWQDSDLYEESKRKNERATPFETDIQSIGEKRGEDKEELEQFIKSLRNMLTYLPERRSYPIEGFLLRV